MMIEKTYKLGVLYGIGPETEMLTQSMLDEIEGYAPGLELDEIYAYFGSKEDFSEAEVIWIERAHGRGRVRAKKLAVDNLFLSMKDRNGQNASIPYLRRFADKWEGDDVTEGDLLVFRANAK